MRLWQLKFSCHLTSQVKIWCQVASNYSVSCDPPPLTGPLCWHEIWNWTRWTSHRKEQDSVCSWKEAFNRDIHARWPPEKTTKLAFPVACGPSRNPCKAPTFHKTKDNHDAPDCRQQGSHCSPQPSICNWESITPNVWQLHNDHEDKRKQDWNDSGVFLFRHFYETQACVKELLNSSCWDMKILHVPCTGTQEIWWTAAMGSLTWWRCVGERVTEAASTITPTHTASSRCSTAPSGKACSPGRRTPRTREKWPNLTLLTIPRTVWPT